MACGRRWGKTVLGLLAAIRGHGAHRRQFLGAVDGGRIWWVSPSYPQLVASEAWEQLKRATAGATKEVSEAERQIDLLGGGSIAVRTANSDAGLRGTGLDGLIIDEAAFCDVYVWQNILRPALTDRNGWAMLLSTPNGKNWFHKSFLDAATRPGWARWQRPSIDNPLITQAEMDDVLREIGPRRFAQEHLAQFTDIEGALWPSDYFGDEMWTDELPDAFELSAVAVDPALSDKATADYSAIVFVGLLGGTFWVDADLAKRNPAQLVDATIRFFQRYRPTAFACEGNLFQSLLRGQLDARCRELFVPPLPTKLLMNNEPKRIRIQRLDPHLAARRFRFLRNDACQLVVDQLQSFPLAEYKDDGPDALEMAVRLLQELVGLREEDAAGEPVEENVYA